jgi:class 3 adenylate cyclase
MSTQPESGERPAEGTEPLAPPATPRTAPLSTQATEAPTSPAPFTTPGPTHTLPEVFGRYRIVRPLGAGGMGSVYLAHDTQLDRPVALKVPHFDPPPSPQSLERFYREARAAATLNHPNICQVYDVGDVGGVPYLTMAYVEGQTLAELASTPPGLSPRQAAALVRALALALHEAHAKGVIHRDLKPSNILIDRRGEPVITDFGLARRLHLGEERLTQQGVLMGTPAYMSPEQVSGDPQGIGPPSDVYSLGVILYELLAGRLPFLGGTEALVARALKDPPPPSHHRPDLDPRFEAVCLRAVAREVAGRFASMAEFAQALDELLREDRPAAPAATHPPPLDPRLVEEALEALRTWGWAMGVRKLKRAANGARAERRRAPLQFLVRWLSGEADAHVHARERLGGTPQWTALAGWALAGQASLALRERQLRAARKLADQAAAEGDPGDTVLRATLAHTHGVAHAHEGHWERALPQLHEALSLLGREHFAAGRVLDSLGMVHAGKGNFPIAREFYEQALLHKRRHDDDVGQALSHGQLGRLFLDWGQLDRAEEHFQADLRLAEKLQDEGGEAQMYNHLGQVALARGKREAAAGRMATARRLWVEAAGWLEGSIARSGQGGRAVTEGFARKDLALIRLNEGDIDGAEAEVQRAEEVLRAARFAEGLALVNCVWGLVRRAQGRYDEAGRALREALAHFDETQERAEAARVQWEVARTLQAAAAPRPLVARAYLEALARADACRRPALVAAVEQDLREADHEAYFRRAYRRARGAAADEDGPGPGGASVELVTVLALSLQGFTEHARGLDAEEALLTLNQLLADLAEVLDGHKGHVLSYVGDGFVALFREARHAERAVSAALGLVAALQELNRPRAILGLPLFGARVGAHTGKAILGDVGGEKKTDFTAVGPAAQGAAHLLHWAEPGLPCVSRATWEQVRERFHFRAEAPRAVPASAGGPAEAWDVTGPRG